MCGELQVPGGSLPDLTSVHFPPPHYLPHRTPEQDYHHNRYVSVPHCYIFDILLCVILAEKHFCHEQLINEAPNVANISDIATVRKPCKEIALKSLSFEN